MIKNHFKIAWRSLMRSKGYTAINSLGLSMGMAGAILIFLWAFHEKSYDRFFEKADHTYQFWSQAPVDGKVFSFEYTPEILAPSLQKTFPEIEAVTSYLPQGPRTFRIGDKKLNQVTAFIDSSFFTVFDFEFAEGNTSSFFRDPMSAILTESAAKLFFDSADGAIGKTIQLDSRHSINVSAILKDLPANTEFQFKVLLPYDLAKALHENDEDWDSFEAQTFMVCRKNSDATALLQKLASFMHPHLEDVDIDLYALPLAKRHLQSNFENGQLTGGKIILVNSAILIAWLILAIACINFMNLSTAKSEKRAKEVGIRKVTGANRSSLIAQFLCEAILMAMISGIIALLLVTVLLPYFNQLTGQQIVIPFDQPVFWLLFLGFIVFTGMLAGSYPAFFLSSFQPVRVLKSVIISTKSGLSLRKILVVSQFTIAIALITSTFVIYTQIDHAQKRHAGYDKVRLVYLRLSDVQERNYASIRHQLLSSGVASSASQTFSPITDPDAMGNGYTWDGYSASGTSSIMFLSFATTSGLLETTGIELLAGRDLDLDNFPTDSGSMLINEAAAQAMNMVDPVGKWVERDGMRWNIVGLVRDFIVESPFQKIQPLFIMGPYGDMNTMHIRLNNDITTTDALAEMQAIFQRYDRNAPFDYHFVDEDYANKFNEERGAAKLAILFTVLAIAISCLGLFGLTAFTAQQRAKEIGIRKVLGASVSGIVALLSKDFVKLVLIAVLLASPIAWWAMSHWLDHFTYRIDIEWWMFAVSGLAAIAVAIFTVAAQAVKAAMANPVDSLRDE
ncbi:ABC transporter permease [Olivibacter sitiensis]|uniref:ABC transporter permease n=1 Tax=Olivibacter sitiensis TaxID=376470 RepID=UPI00048969B5|nr:ABC transporter permease [Olivibacter sitiensis]